MKDTDDLAEQIEDQYRKQRYIEWQYELEEAIRQSEENRKD